MLIVALSAVIPMRVRAQVAGATLSGTVTDASGAGLPKAQITIKNVATGVTRELTTDAAGFYTAPNLIPGTYEVATSAVGFTTTVRTGITLTVGAQQVLDLTLQVGSMTQKIEVSGEAPTVQLSSATISATVDSTTVRELPLNGRSWTDLAVLQPGVLAIQTQTSFTAGADRGNKGFGAQITISGARPQQNNYRLDGISINDYSNGAPGSVLGGNLGVDAIQEFSVLTNNYSAEYGRTAGGVVNAITRSGANQLHGSVYEFLRNGALDARNFFDGAKIPPFRRNQFGASAGGPIIKDRTFFFGDYEAVRQSKGITYIDTVPSPAIRGIGTGPGGSTGPSTVCSNPLGADPTKPCSTQTLASYVIQKGLSNLNPDATTGIDKSALLYLPFYPLPNGPILGNGDTGRFSFAAQQVVSENFFTTRIDHKFSEKDNISGTYLYDDTSYQSPDALEVQLLGSHTNRQVVAIEEGHVFNPTLINTVRLGYSRERVTNNGGVSAINPLATDTTLGAVAGGNAAQVGVGGGLTRLSGGIGGLSTFLYFWNSFQVYDDAFVTHGKHSLKFGVSAERIFLDVSQKTNPNGVFSFGSLPAFLINNASRLNGPSGTPRDLRETVFGAYLQDDWRWRPNLTLNLGLRYEFATVLKEAHGKLSNLLNITDTTAHLGDPYFLNPTLRNFAPRVGFAWDPFGNGKTAVRGGFGMFDVLPLPYQFMLASSSQPFTFTRSIQPLPPGAFFAGAAALLKAPNSLGQTFIEHAPKRNYVMQWNVNVQRQVLPSLTALAGYVGSRGVHQPIQTDDMNIVMPVLSSAGYLFPSPVTSGENINTTFAAIRGILYQGNSSYNGLLVGVQKKMSRGFQMHGSFTWGRSIDTGSATVGGDQFGNSISSLWPWTNPNANRALSDFNVSRTLVFSATWDIPGLKSVSGPLGWATNGWELGAIFTASDGVPFSPTFGTDGDPLGINSNDPWDFPSRLKGPGCGSLINPGNPDNYIKTQCFAVPTAPSAAFWTANCDPAFGDLTNLQCINLRGNAGRNILIGPGTSNLDFSIFKNNPVRRISESFNIQFRAEVFNILNHANFAVPVLIDNTDIFDSGGAPNDAAGLLTSTTTTAREIQFALKFIW
jgi:hypothetical protein